MRSLFSLAITALLLLGCKQKEPGIIRIAAAANMQYAMKELAAQFTSKTGIRCELIISSSGKLSAQIVEGAPFDVLVAANIKYPEYIESEGLAAQAPEIYAYGKLVLWTLDKTINPRPALLTDPSIKKIALANPKTAPYGEASMEYMENTGMINSVNHKFVYGESIAQTNQFISTGAVSMGFTSLSTVLGQPMNNRGKWYVLNEKEYAPIAQAAVLIQRKDEEKPGAKLFYDYLFSTEAGKILEEFGYSGNE